jgi:hypothetical protein
MNCVAAGGILEMVLLYLNDLMLRSLLLTGLRSDGINGELFSLGCDMG